MKSTYACLVVFCVTFALPGCESSKDNAVITEDLTADDFAKYEADLARVNAEGTYDDESSEEPVENAEASAQDKK